MTILELVGAAFAFLLVAFAGGAWWGGRRRDAPSAQAPSAKPVTANTSTKIDELDDAVIAETADIGPPPDPADYPDDDPDAVTVVSGWTDDL